MRSLADPFSWFGQKVKDQSRRILASLKRRIPRKRISKMILLYYTIKLVCIPEIATIRHSDVGETILKQCIEITN